VEKERRGGGEVRGEARREGRGKQK